MLGGALGDLTTSGFCAAAYCSTPKALPVVESLRVRVSTPRFCLALGLPRATSFPVTDGFSLLYSIASIRLSGYPGKGLNFSFQRQASWRQNFSVLDSVPIAPGSPAAGPVHPTDARSPDCRRSARLPAPLRFGRRHLDARCIGKCMGLILRFSAPLPPSAGALTLPSDRLAAPSAT